jgi:uncharacterized protein (TIGR02145 family)
MSYSGNSFVTLMIMTLIVISSASCKKEDKDTIKDKDGNVYHSVVIGNQTWMVENLRTTQYNDGSKIPMVTDSATWATTYTGAFCWYLNDASYGKTYGALYNLPAVNSGKLAPQGWHVATKDEWKELINYLGGYNVAGYHLKEADTLHWMYLNKADNSSGFTALPGGNCYGAFQGLGYIGDWWSYTDGNFDRSATYHMNWIDSSVREENRLLIWGCSVRCVKDN